MEHEVRRLLDLTSLQRFQIDNDADTLTKIQAKMKADANVRA
jgi:hypothetical protein